MRYLISIVALSMLALTAAGRDGDDGAAAQATPQNRTLPSEGLPAAARARLARREQLLRQQDKARMFAVAPAKRLPGCPVGAPAWAAWRDDAIEHLLNPRLVDPEARPEDQADSETLYLEQVGTQSTAIMNTIQFCEPDADARVDHLYGFVWTQHNATDVLHEFGHGSIDPQFDLDDFSYLERVREFVELPAALKTTEFLDAISNADTYASALRLVAKRNVAAAAEAAADPGDLRKRRLAEPWLVLAYKSQFLSTPDHARTAGRFLVVVPGEHFDRWVQFGIHTPDETRQETINNVSVVTITHRDRGGPPFNALIDWWRIYTADKTIRLATRRESQGITGNCLECHKALPLGIHPGELYSFDANDKMIVLPRAQLDSDPALLAVNRKLLEYGPPDVATLAGDELASTGNYGPSLGPAYKTRDPAFLNSCTGGQLSQASITRVADAMSCSGCHSADKRGLLNYPQALRRVKDPTNQIYQYIRQGFMPPAQVLDQPLSDPEREALYRCISDEYQPLDASSRPPGSPGLFKEWLRNETPGHHMADTVGPALQREQFRYNCQICHSLKPNGAGHGPSLYGVLGRRAGSLAGYKFSPDMTRAGKVGLVWTEDKLVEYLKDPGTFIGAVLSPGAQPPQPADLAMKKSFADETLRRNVVAYVRAASSVAGH